MARSKHSLGLEYLGDEIRMVLVESTEEGVEVRHMQTVRATEELPRVFRALPRRPSSVTCVVPLEQAALRILDLPPTTEENLDRVVTMEAETVLPLSAEELALSYHVLGMTEQSRLEVMLAAARQNVVQNLLKRVNCAPWVSATVTVTPVALYNAVQQLRGPSSEPVCAILKVEERHSEFLVMDRARIILAQPIPVGCASEVPAPAPEPVSVGGGEGSAPAVAAAPGWARTLAQQLRYAVQALSYERGLQIQRLYLCGKGAGEPGADWEVSEALDCPVTLLSFPAGDPAEAATYATAYGCAVQAAGKAAVTLNLTPARVAVAREVEQRRQAQVSWGALAAAVVAAAGLVFGAMVYREQQGLAADQEKLRQVQALGVRAPEALPSRVKSSAQAVQAQLETRVPPARLLTVLSQQLPAGTWLAELSYQSDGNTVLRAHTTDPRGAQQTQIRLLRLQMFDEITLDFSNQEAINNVPVWAFQLTCRQKRELGR
ncbi:MAG: pilus assembly protein PilM [Armatimonadota bacterium]